MSTKVKLVCIPSDWVVLNEPFILKSQEGTPIAIISTTILVIYIILNLIMYHFRTCCAEKDTIKIFLTRWQKILNLIYMGFLLIFEIIWIYGTTMSNDASTDGEEQTDIKNIPTFLSIVNWVIVNTLATTCLLIGFFSKKDLEF